MDGPLHCVRESAGESPSRKSDETGEGRGGGRGGTELGLTDLSVSESKVLHAFQAHELDIEGDEEKGGHLRDGTLNGSLAKYQVW